MEDVEDGQLLARLTGELQWLQRLARALVNADGSEDLAHETWLVAHTHAPRDGRPLRPWLGQVALNLVRMQVRGRQRREAREQATGAFVEPVPTPEELVQRVQLQRRVAGEVLQLAEPYRSTLLLHYVEDLPCAEIARRLGLDATVRGRLKAALDQLRARLRDRESGGLAALAASAPETIAAIAHVALSDPTLAPPSDQLELRLRDCTSSIAGTVVDASGNPLPRSRVRREGLVGVETDARGAYHLCVPFGDVELEYGADGYGTVVLTVDVRGEMERDVTLVPEAAVAVRVVRTDTGAPVPDAFVGVFPKQWGPDRAATRSAIADRDGKARIAGLVPGRYNVYGYAESLNAHGDVEVLAEVASSPDVVLQLDATARIRGKVTSGDRPVGGAHVAAVRKLPMMRSPQVISQPDGAFVLDRVPPGEVVFLAPPYDVASPARLEVVAGKTYSVIVDVHALGAIRGRVTRLGRPVDGVGVCCARSNLTSEPTVRTDADGHYELAGVVAGTYTIAAGDDWVGAFTLGKPVTLAAGEVRTLDLELELAGTIAGVVVDREGKPVKGVFVRWVNEKTADVGRCMSDAQGRYRCASMSGGATYRAAVFPTSDQQVTYPTADGTPYPAVELKDGSSVVEGVKPAIDRPQLVISGRVVDDAGAPIADAIVKLLPVRAGQTAQFHLWLRLPTSSTDADGAFTVGGLAPGSYAVQARAVDGSQGIAQPVAAAATGVVVRVERAGAIAGKLVGFAQTPAVYARTLGTFTLAPAVVDGATFRVNGLGPGRYMLTAQTTREGDAQVVEIRAGQTSNVVLTSHGQGAIEGSVLDFRTRSPIASAVCMVVMAVDGERGVASWDFGTAARSDARGRVVIDPAPAGSVSVTCEMPTFRWSRPSADVTVTTGGRASVQLLSAELTQENPGAIGITFDQRVTPPRVASVLPGSTGARAGIQAGDLVTAVAGVSVQGLSGAGVNTLINSTPIGNDVKLTVLRAGATRTFTAKVVADDQ